MYENTKDHKKAFFWYWLSAKEGYAEGQLSLGAMYYKGEGVTQDYKEACNWYLLSAEQGHTEAQYKLGAMYENGKGVPQDNEEAVYWYRLSAEHEEMAQCKLTAMNDKDILSQFIINTMAN